MKHLIAVFCCLTIFKTFAQEPKIKFGEVSKEELQMKVYPKDSTAEAVVLYEFGETSFEFVQSGTGNRGGSYALRIVTIYHEHKRIKILKKSAFSRATIQIPYDNASIKAFTYNIENGEVNKEKLPKESIFKEKSVNDFSTTKISFPNVKEGSIIEYSYDVEVQGIRLSSWDFQEDIPKSWSEYRLKTPEYFIYRTLMAGYLNMTINKREEVNQNFGTMNVRCDYFRYAIQDVSAFKNEPFITTTRDYTARIDFELASIVWPNVITKDYSLDYKSLNSNLLNENAFGEALKKRGFLSDIAKGIKAKTKEPSELIQAAVDSVRANMKWDENYSYSCENLKKAFDKRMGDVGDINLTLVALLREIGLTANPVILSTRLHGRIDENFALRQRFNYVVAMVELDGKEISLDATDKYLPVGMLPERCLNKKGWLVHETAGRFVSLEPTFKDVNFTKAEFTITENNELKGVVSHSFSGYAAHKARTAFHKEGKEKYIESIKNNKPTWTILTTEFDNVGDNNSVFLEKNEISTNDFITEAGNMLYLKPMLSEGRTENPFKTSTRVFPIDFGKVLEEQYIGVFEVPKGYSVLELPKNEVVSLPDNGGKFTYIAMQSEGKINISSRVIFKKAFYHANEYESLKEFFNKIVAKANEQIVLKKN